MEQHYNAEMYDWDFPEVELVLPAINEASFSSPTVQQAKSAETEIISEAPDPKLLELQEIENMKQEFASKISIVGNILNKLKYPMSIIDDELIEILMDMVKKTVMKVIHKEIKEDEQLINKMIKELTAMMDPKESMVDIYLSPNDFNRLNADDHPSALAHTDTTLKEGDIIIKSNFNEVRAMMNERIDNLLRVQYD